MAAKRARHEPESAVYIGSDDLCCEVSAIGRTWEASAPTSNIDAPGRRVRPTVFKMNDSQWMSSMCTLRERRRAICMETMKCRSANHRQDTVRQVTVNASNDSTQINTSSNLQDKVRQQL